MNPTGRGRAARAVAALLLICAAIARADEFAPLPEVPEGHETAIFAGGCFWCVEADFDKVPGVVSTTSGYTGGHTTRPAYIDVLTETTGHYEAVMIVFQPATVSYEQLLTVFWHSVDPTDAGGQFCDRGKSYTTAIFCKDEAQCSAAEESKAALLEAPVPADPIVTPIIAAAPFWPAEVYHQDYYLNEKRQWTRFGWVKRSHAYKEYRAGCGRDARVREVWGDLAFTGIPQH